jgi:ATP-dependent DNA helicase DinG
MEAKAKLLETQGLDPFHALHLPEAIIRFKQGIGRLIRTKDDKGVVILLDDRVIKKNYGKYFLNRFQSVIFSGQYRKSNSSGWILDLIF